MRYENDGSGVREVKSRIRVQTTAGLGLGGQLVFPYTAVDEDVEIRNVRVLKADGGIITAGPEAVQDLSAQVTREAPMYTDAREKHVTVPGVAVGDAVEYDVVWKAKPFTPGQFWFIWIFDNRMISLDEQLDVDVPAGRALKIKTTGGITPSIKLEGERRLYHWSTSNLTVPPPVDFFKNFTFDVIKLLEGPRPAPPPRVAFSTFQTWGEISDWYAKLESDRRVPSAEIRAKADEIVRGQTTDETKSQALYYWVSQNIRYVSLSFGVGRYQPHPAAEVFNNRYGDCKDKTTLLEAMLASEGITAQPVLANADIPVDPDVPNPYAFDHAFTFLRVGNNDIWLDTTLGVGPFGYLAPQLRGQNVLVVASNVPAALQQTPTDFPSAVQYHLSVDGSVDASGTLDATAVLETRGDLEVLIRFFSAHTSAEQLDKTADSLLAGANRFLYDSSHFTDFRVLNGSDIAQPLQVQFHVTGKPMYVNVSTGTPAQLAAAVTSMPIERWGLLSLLPGASANKDSSSRPHSQSTFLYGPRSYSFSVKVTFPAFGVVDLPPARKDSINAPFAFYESSDAWEGSTFRGSRQLTLIAPEISAGESDQYAAFVQKVVAQASEGSEDFLAARKKPPIPATTPATTAAATPVPTPAPTPVPRSATTPALAPKTTPATESRAAYDPPGSAHDFFNKGREEAQRKNWANAIGAFQSALTADPAYPDAWRELGRAQMYARHFPDAESDFRTYLELAPDDSRAYLNMAWVLYSEEKYQEDVDLMLKRIDDAPLDGDALARLGLAYLALHQPDKAIPVLDRATSRFPKYALAYFSLGRAYLQTKQNDKAIVSFRLALTYNTSDSMLNSVAYELAESNSNLDLAEAWSQQSIATVEKELNDSSLGTVGARTWPFVVKLGAYWDTLGWIKFQQRKTDEAQEYILAAWQLADDPTIAMHLGQVAEAEGHKDEAIRMYLAALAVAHPDRKLSDDSAETRKKLANLLGGDSLVDARLQEFRKIPSSLRTVIVPNPEGIQGIAQLTVIIGVNSAIVDLVPTIPDDALAAVTDSLRKTSAPQSFPDTSIQKLPRLATLACPVATQPCVFTLLPSPTLARVAASD
jgi:tetratricopeptide (TPR) repeat protein